MLVVFYVLITLGAILTMEFVAWWAHKKLMHGWLWNWHEDHHLPHHEKDGFFEKNDLFFAYPNNYNHYVSYYRNTYQHGGVSLEEVIIPFAVLTPK